MVTSAADTATYVRDAPHALASIVATMAEGVNLRDLLRHAGGLVLEATGARRASFFLLEPNGSSLGLWSATGDPATELWTLGLSLGAIGLDEVPLRRELLDTGHTVVIPDAARSDVVPQEWVRAFDLASVAITPLRCGGTVLGILAVDYPKVGELRADAVEELERMAAACSLAISHALKTDDLRQRNAELRDLLDVVRAAELAGPDEVMRRAGAALERLVGAATVRFLMFEEDEAGISLSPACEDPLGSVAAAAADQWQSDHFPGRLLVQDGRSTLCCPLAAQDGRLLGMCLAVAPAHALGVERMALASGLAAHVALAVERSRLEQATAVAAETARTLVALSAFGEDNSNLLAGLRSALPPALGFRVDALWTRVNGRRPDGPLLAGEADMLRRWRRRRTRPAVEALGSVLFAPIWATDDRLLGMIVATQVGDGGHARRETLIEQLASALGPPLEREALQAVIEARAREAAVMRERWRFSRDLQASGGDLLASLVERTERAASVGASTEELRQTAALAAAVAAALGRTAGDRLPDSAYIRGGLEAALRRLVHHVCEDSQVWGTFQVRGDRWALSLEAEQCLLRLAHDALTRLALPGRASQITVRLEFGLDGVGLVVADDGTDLMTRTAPDRLGPFHGVRQLQRRIEDLGGSIRVRHVPPRGIEIRALIPSGPVDGPADARQR